MKKLTFPGGIHPAYNKEVSIREPLREPPLPEKVVIPLLQHIGAPNEPVVKKGDYVEEGQLIGRSAAFISSPVHSPVFGAVKDIIKSDHPTLGISMSVVIERDKTKLPKKYTERAVNGYSTQDLAGMVKEKGLVGMGGAGFPTHVKLGVPEGKKVEILLINGAECEPFLTCDHVLMTRKPAEILKGIGVIARIIKPDLTYLVIEDNKKTAISAFQKIIDSTKGTEAGKIELVTVHTKYPQGGEKQLIKSVTGREVPPGKLPIDISVLVHNVGTAYAIYEAVYLDKPLIERIVTISGDCIERPGNYLLKIGTTIREIIEKYGISMYKDPEKIIVGGPMMGFAQMDVEAPVVKGTCGILFLSRDHIREFEEDNCIKCAKCVDVCPMRLSPTEIMKNAKQAKWAKMEELWISDCMECGACAYSCPARIPLVQYIKESKAALRKIAK